MKKNGRPGYKLIFRAGDYDSPSGLDTVRVQLFNLGGTEIYDTHDEDFKDESTCAGTARTGLDNGNIKIDFVSNESDCVNSVRTGLDNKNVKIEFRGLNFKG